MTAKIKTNILYIASDNSSQQQTQSTSTKNQKQQKQEKRSQFNLKGCHRLNNNKLSKGFFNNQVNELEYQHQKFPQKQLIQHKTSMIKRQPKLKILTTQLNNQDNIPCVIQHEINSNYNKVIQKTKQIPPQNQQNNKNDNKKIQKVKRSKTLLFEFKQQSDSQNNQQTSKSQSNIQQLKKDIESIVEKKMSQPICIIRENQPKNNEQQKINQQQAIKQKVIRSLSPLDLQNKIDKKQFVISQVPQRTVLQCKVMKKNQLSNFLFSQFDMIFRDFNHVHIASCKKFIGNLTSNYRISLQNDNFQYCQSNIIGKVRQMENKKNLYNIYDNGKNPQKADNNYSNLAQIRQILATVRLKCGKGPRNVEVYVLKDGYKYRELFGISLSKQINLQSLYSIQQNRQKIKLYRSRKPVWISSRGEYFLDFKGRVNQASIRNFILQDPQTGKQILMFGKNQNNIYNLDISYPLTPGLGLALVIPQLDKDQ